MTDGQIMTRQELAEYLGVSEPTLYRYIRRGLIPYNRVKINRSKVGYKKQFFYCDEIEELKRIRNILKGV